MKFNINDCVRVKLTQVGRDILEQHHREMCASLSDYLPYIPKEEDAEGWSSWQLWILMRNFGGLTMGGMDLPFETEIEIIEGKS